MPQWYAVSLQFGVVNVCTRDVNPRTLDKLTASFVDVCAFSPVLLKESEECTDKDFLERFEEDIADAEGRLSPTAEHVKQRVTWC